MLRQGADAAANAALISAAINPGDRRQVREARAALASFRDALVGAHDSVPAFKAAIQGLPRMTAELNRAKRSTTAVLGDVLEGLGEGQRIATETVRSLDALLDGEPDT
jgi:hypothetical protein